MHHKIHYCEAPPPPHFSFFEPEGVPVGDIPRSGTFFLLREERGSSNLGGRKPFSLREKPLGKTPCIVGTGNATPIFKDGDLVEVDAACGTIKKI